MSAKGGLTQKRHWIAGAGHEPMALKPGYLLKRHEIVRGAGGSRAERNAVYAGERLQFKCDDCGCIFPDAAMSACHAARTGHVVLRKHMAAIKAVDPQEFLEDWEDIFGVPGSSRWPQKETEGERK